MHNFDQHITDGDDVGDYDYGVDHALPGERLRHRPDPTDDPHRERRADRPA